MNLVAVRGKRFDVAPPMRLVRDIHERGATVSPGTFVDYAIATPSRTTERWIANPSAVASAVPGEAVVVCMGRFSSPVIDGVRVDGLISLPYEQFVRYIGERVCPAPDTVRCAAAGVAERVIFRNASSSTTLRGSTSRGTCSSRRLTVRRVGRQLPFTQSRRLMYNNWVDEPRLSCGLD